MYANLTINNFLEELSSDKPTPGGGSVAALCGALASSLFSMVASLSLGKKGYENHQEYFKEAIETCGKYTQRFKDIMDEDALAFDEVMKAYKLPRTSDEEKSSRKNAIQESLKQACKVPLKTMQLSWELYNYAIPLSEVGNKSALSDAFCGLELCKTAKKMAGENVDINLDSITDEQFRYLVLDELKKYVF